MIYLTLTILSLYIFDPFKRLNGGLWGLLRRKYLRPFMLGSRLIGKGFFDLSNPSTYTKPEESSLSKFPLEYEEWL